MATLCAEQILSAYEFIISVIYVLQIILIVVLLNTRLTLVLTKVGLTILVIILAASAGSMGEYTVVGLMKFNFGLLHVTTRYEVQRPAKDDRFSKGLP